MSVHRACWAAWARTDRWCRRLPAPLSRLRSGSEACLRGHRASVSSAVPLPWSIGWGQGDRGRSRHASRGSSGRPPSGNSPRVPKSRAPAVAVRPGLLMSRWGAAGSATLVRLIGSPSSAAKSSLGYRVSGRSGERDRGNLREWCR
jgi:hypothetical protein